MIFIIFNSMHAHVSVEARDQACWAFWSWSCSGSELASMHSGNSSPLSVRAPKCKESLQPLEYAMCHLGVLRGYYGVLTNGFCVCCSQVHASLPGDVSYLPLLSFSTLVSEPQGSSGLCLLRTGTTGICLPICFLCGW